MKTLRNRVVPVLVASLCLAGAAPAWAGGFGGESSLPFVDQIAVWFGLESLSGADRDALAIGALLYAVPFGFLTHMAFAESGFGRFGNALVGILGVGLAYFAGAPYFRSLPTAMQFNITLLACGCASAVMLVFCAMAKEIGHRGLARLFNNRSGAKRRKPEAADAVSTRVAAALRKS
jgi:hypothetical protein